MARRSYGTGGTVPRAATPVVSETWYGRSHVGGGERVKQRESGRSAGRGAEKG